MTSPQESTGNLGSYDYSNKQALRSRENRWPRCFSVRFNKMKWTGLLQTFGKQIVGSGRRLPNLVTFSRLNGAGGDSGRPDEAKLT